MVVEEGQDADRRLALDDAVERGVTVGQLRDVLSVSVSAADENGVERVELYAGGLLVNVDLAPPWELLWDASGLPRGRYALTAVAYDPAGNPGSSPLMYVRLR